MSSYDPVRDDWRLSIQGDFCAAPDERAIRRALTLLEGTIPARRLRVLDIGCGTGYVTSSRFGDNDKFEVLALDRSREAIHLAATRYGNTGIEFVQADFMEWEPADDTFDLVWLSQVLQHAADPWRMLLRAGGCLRMGGVLLLHNSDDGSYLVHPMNDEVAYLLQQTEKLEGHSDRRIGRKLWGWLTAMSGPGEVWGAEMLFDVTSTAGLDLDGRARYFDDCFLFRVTLAERLARAPGVSVEVRQRAETMREYFERQRTLFVPNRSQFACCNQFYGIAQRLRLPARPEHASRAERAAADPDAEEGQEVHGAARAPLFYSFGSGGGPSGM